MKGGRRRRGENDQVYYKHSFFFFFSNVEMETRGTCLYPFLYSTDLYL